MNPKHVRRKDSDVLPAFIAKFQEVLQNYVEEPTPAIEDNSIKLSEKLTDLTKRRTRLIDAYEAGVLPIAEYTSRVSEIEINIRNTEAEVNELNNASEKIVSRADLVELIKKNLNDNPDYIANDPAAEVNAQLRKLIRAIIIDKDEVAIQFIV